MGEVLALDELMAARTVWRASRGSALNHEGEPTGHPTLDGVLPTGGWPRKALTELLLPADGVGEIALLLPTLARMTAAGKRVVLVATIDNLLKGAATQALQNLNRALGLDELTAIPH